MQESQTEKEEMRQQQRMNEGHDRYDKENQVKGRMDANSSWWVSELLAADCLKIEGACG